MDDLILQSYVSSFASSHGFHESKADGQFEHFLNYCIVARDYQGSFDVEDLSTGRAMGIDGLAILVNDQLVISPTEIDGVARSRLDARFVFMQAKTSPTLDLGEFLKFLTAVEQFFQLRSGYSGHALETWLDLKDKIYKQAIKFDENPKLTLIYGYPGLLQKASHITQQKDAFISRLKLTGLFRDVEVEIFDGDKLKSIYRGLSNKITRQISFDKHTILPRIPGVKRAFIGILPCNEYLRLICNDDKKLMRNVFYDNVRDFQGNNPVNREIMETINGEDDGGRFFVLLNNGVTIVAKSINPVGTDFTVRDFQVVNGCQTSHILYNNQDCLSGDEFITVKLIETDDVELTNKITKATNRQTAVTLEAFAGLKQFHKELEAFYASFPLEQRLYYERRSGQFDGEQSVTQSLVISIPNQIKAFVSIFLEEPHQIHFYYGKLLEDYSTGENSRLFNDQHDTYPYYMASWLAYLLNAKLRKGGDSEFKRWRYHLALMMRAIIGGPFVINRLNDKKYCKAYCENIASALSDKGRFDRTFAQAQQLLSKEAAVRKLPDRTLTQDRTLTKRLVDLSIDLSKKASQNKGGSNKPVADTPAFDGYFVGKVKKLVPTKQCGYVQYGTRQFYFRLKDEQLDVGQNVKFRLRAGGSSESEAYDLIRH